MTEKIVDISKSLWLKVDVVHPDYDDGIFHIQDDTGGDALIDKGEILRLIGALKRVLEDKELQWQG